MATLPAGRASAWWMADLEQAHAHQLALIADLDGLTAQPVPDVPRLANVRWKMSQASRERRHILNSIVYPDLAKRLVPAEAEMVKRLREKETVAMAASAQHIAKWTMDRIVADWAGYARDSSAMRASLRKRMAAEMEVLSLISGAPSPSR